jgi:hypothetical protein
VFITDQKPPMCTTSTGLVVKQDNCAQFYDCSKPVTELGQYIQECPYPQLFNEDTHQCEHFKTFIRYNIHQINLPNISTLIIFNLLKAVSIR